MKTSLSMITAIAAFTAFGAACAEESAVEVIVVTAKRAAPAVEEIVVTAKRVDAPARLDLAAAARRALEAMLIEIDAPTVDAPKIDLRVAAALDGRLTASAEPQPR